MSRYGTWLVDIFVLLVVIGPSAWPRQLGGRGLVGVVGQTPPARTEIEVCKKLDKARGYKDDRCGKKWGVFQTARRRVLGCSRGGVLLGHGLYSQVSCRACEVVDSEQGHNYAGCNEHQGLG